jgi:uncharacterized repeat protein (TIGR02543 family)
MKKLLIGLLLLLNSVFIQAQEVSITGNKFTLGESEIWFNGINTPWHLFDDFGRSDFDPDWWTEEFAKYKDNHINLARVWIHGSGEVSPDIDATGYVSGASDLFWEHMDYLMDVSEANQVYVLPALLSFDITKNTYTTYEYWRAFLQSESNIQSYIDNVLIPLVERYNDRPYLLGWEICNEPEWMFENSEHGPQSFDDVQKLHAMFAAAVHENSTKPVTTGSAAPKWNSPIYDSWGEYEGNMFSDDALSAAINNSNAYLDFYQYHWYAWQTEWMESPFTMSTAAYEVDDRPVIVGESEGNDVCDEYICQTLVEMYENAYLNGFDGVCAWKTPQNDGHGTFENIAVATNAFYSSYPLLVYPDGSDPIPVEGVSLSENLITIEDRETFQLTAIITPSDASDKRVSWVSDNTDVATVSNGLVTGVIPGTATITATTSDGGYSASCTVEVVLHGPVCDEPVEVTPPFSQDGEGTYCFVTSGTIDNINSWGMEILEINGVDYADSFSNTMPARIDGNYYIYYIANYSWSHMEIAGSGGTSEEYSLTVNTVGNGSVSPGSGVYTDGTTVTLTATPDEGYEFSGWSGDASGSSISTSIVMDADKSVTATFIPETNADEYTLTVSVVGMGSVTPSGGVYDSGTVVTIAATPDAGYSFASWSGDISGTSSTIDITMSSDKNITATFEEVNGDSCESPLEISIPHMQDGIGEFCWVTSDDIASVNSWGLASLTINGVDYTNSYSGSFPAKIDGNYYIYYLGNNAWSHFEASALKFGESIKIASDVEIKAFPNPFTKYFVLKLDHPERVIRISIYNNLGKIVESIDKNRISSEVICDAIKKQGVYYIQIETEKSIQTNCILKY